MNVNEVVQYWLQSAAEDWPVAEHLLASGDYHYVLFFGHLYLEKLLKASVVKMTGVHAPRTHNLLLLAERAGLDIQNDRRNMLIQMTGYTIEARYPEGPPTVRRRYTREYVVRELERIREIGEWLKSELTHKSA